MWQSQQSGIGKKATDLLVNGIFLLTIFPLQLVLTKDRGFLRPFSCFLFLLLKEVIISSIDICIISFHQILKTSSFAFYHDIIIL